MIDESFKYRVCCKHPYTCAMVLERYGEVLDLEFFSYSTTACVSALRNTSLPLLLRIYQLVLFFPTFSFWKQCEKKRMVEQGGDFPQYAELLYLSSL